MTQKSHIIFTHSVFDFEYSVSGKQDSVMEAKREILKRFQTQSSSSVDIPKEYHGIILGKGGKNLKELEKQTGTKIVIPKENESGRIVVTGPKEGKVGN